MDCLVETGSESERRQGVTGDQGLAAEMTPLAPFARSDCPSQRHDLRMAIQVLPARLLLMKVRSAAEESLELELPAGSQVREYKV